MMQEQAQVPDQTQVVVQPAGFGERLVAYLIDGVILFVMELVLMLLLGQPLGSLLSFFASIAYTVGFWMTQAATPGKMVMGLRVIRQDGAPIDGSTAALRYVGYIVSGIVIGLGFLWIIWDPNHEGWHDKIAKTWVIKTQR
jgi:uncharacterized RDD family membrane protein YckC